MTHDIRRFMNAIRPLTEAAAARSGPGWQPVSALVASAYSALDDMGEDEFERFEASSPWRKVAYRYLSADCDNFAVGLHRVTNWPIVGNAAHRLVRGPRGLIDASGWVTEAKLQQRYRQWWQALGEPGGEATAHSHMIGEIYDGVDELLAEVVSAIRQFPWAPYNTRAFQQMSFRPIPGVDERAEGFDEDGDE
jgi:hypothetical protein